MPPHINLSTCPLLPLPRSAPHLTGICTELLIYVVSPSPSPVPVFINILVFFGTNYKQRLFNVKNITKTFKARPDSILPVLLLLLANTRLYDTVRKCWNVFLIKVKNIKNIWRCGIFTDLEFQTVDKYTCCFYTYSLS